MFLLLGALLGDCGVKAGTPDTLAALVLLDSCRAGPRRGCAWGAGGEAELQAHLTPTPVLRPWHPCTPGRLQGSSQSSIRGQSGWHRPWPLLQGQHPLLRTSENPRSFLLAPILQPASHTSVAE